MHESFQTPSKLVIALEYCECGNLSRLLGRETNKRFCEDVARYYIAEIILAIEHLHKHDVVYRDLKPENILVDAHGHLKLTDFGLSKQINDDLELTDSFCGSHAYMTPEMLERKPHGKSIDWYGVGAVLYECLVSIPPYLNMNPEKLNENILKAHLQIPTFISPECENLIRKLLIRNPNKRLGANGAHEIKSHEWFKGLDWEAAYYRRLPVKVYPLKELKPR